MAKLTRAQIHQIKNIINDHMEVLMQITTGDGNPSPQLVKKLGLPKSITDLITTAYKYGKLGVLQGKDLSTMSESEVSQLMKTIKLTKPQQYSIEQSKIKAQQSIDLITQKITSNVITMAVQSDLNMWEVVKETIPAAPTGATAYTLQLLSKGKIPGTSLLNTLSDFELVLSTEKIYHRPGDASSGIPNRAEGTCLKISRKLINSHKQITEIK